MRVHVRSTRGGHTSAIGHRRMGVVSKAQSMVMVHGTCTHKTHPAWPCWVGTGLHDVCMQAYVHRAWGIKKVLLAFRVPKHKCEVVLTRLG